MITGQSSDGPSEVEELASRQARQQAQRTYQQVYARYRKLSEAVLDSEPIPLGYRQTIRRYFESIRPTSGEVAEGKSMDRP